MQIVILERLNHTSYPMPIRYGVHTVLEPRCGTFHKTLIANCVYNARLNLPVMHFNEEMEHFRPISCSRQLQIVFVMPGRTYRLCISTRKWNFSIDHTEEF